MVAAPSRRVILLTDPNYYVRRWGVVAHWKLDEASGTANDSVGTNHLSATNNPVSGTGKVGSARAFVAASSQYLSIADNAALSTGDVDFGIAAWLTLSDKGTDRGIAGKGAAGVFEHTILYSNALNRLRFHIYTAAGSSNGTATANALGSPATDTWYFVLAWHDTTSASKTVNIRVNHGTTDTTARIGAPTDQAGAFKVGVAANGTNYHSGLIDEVTVFKSPPGGIAGVINEISERLYAGGAGRSSPWL